MTQDTKNHAILGQAIGDALGSYLQENPNMVKKVHEGLRNQKIRIKLVYTAPTQISLLFLQTFHQLEKPHHITVFHEQLQKNQISFPSQWLRHPQYELEETYFSKNPIRDPHIGSALVLGTVATKFSSTDRLMPWLLEFSQHYSSHPVSIAGTVFFGFICSQYYHGSTLLEAIEAFGEWRQSSVALKSPVPDQTFWAYQQASWIALEYNRRPMMEFVGQHLSTTLATPCSNQALTMIPFALSLAQNFADIGSLMHYLSDESILMSRSALTAIGSLCGILMGKNLTSLPKGVEIYNRQLLEEPEDWVAASEQNAPMTKFALLRQNEKSNQQLKLF